MTGGVTSSISTRSSAISLMLRKLANGHAALAVASIQSRRAARGDQHLVQTFAAQLMRKQHVVDVPLELGGGALIARLELGADVGALFAAQRHQAAAKWLLLALILQEAGGRIV